MNKRTKYNKMVIQGSCYISWPMSIPGETWFGDPIGIFRSFHMAAKKKQYIYVHNGGFGPYHRYNILNIDNRQ